MTPAIKRQLFPLRAPRAQTLVFWPVTVLCAAVDGYFEAFFAAFDWDSLK
jgi:hypothetical protein